MKNNKTKEISIKIEGEVWQQALDDAFKEANEKVKVDGFRKGKAPKDIFLKKYGLESLYEGATDKVLNEAYIKLLQENQTLEIVCQPEVRINEINEDGVEFIFGLTLKPEVKLGKYKNLGIKKEEVKVTAEEIDQAVEETLDKYAEMGIKDGIVEVGDTVIIDFEGFKDGVPFDGGKSEDYSLKIGSGTFIPGFEENMVGLKKGDTKDIKLSFPEDYHSEELKGQPVIFKVLIKEIKETIIPELNEEFFKDLGHEGINTKEELENQLKENIMARKEAESENTYIDQLLDEGIKGMEVELPKGMIEEEISRMVGQYEETLQRQGLTLEQFYQFTNSNEEALRNQMTLEAEKRIKSRLMLEAIAKEENIEITEEKANEEVSKLAQKYQMEEEEFLKLFGGIEMVQYDLQIRAAIEVMK